MLYPTQILFSLVGRGAGLLLGCRVGDRISFACDICLDANRISDKIAVRAGWLTNDKMERILKEL